MRISPTDRVSSIYYQESTRVLATLIRLLHGNFDLAEEALQDAFIAALTQWPQDGIPENPRAWLVTTGRFKAIDRLRKITRLDAYLETLTRELEAESEAISYEEETIEDDRLRLIFTCCHPALAIETRVALTLREVCGLTTEAIAAAFLVPVPTLAQRIVRAKNKIRDAGIPYEVPSASEMPARLEAVLPVIYLVYNEAYSATTGSQITQQDLSSEAIRLGRLLQNLLPNSEVSGLLALMLLHDARRGARSNAQGELIPLEDQDRRLWNRTQIAEGCQLVVDALKAAPPGEYVLQGAIAAVHCEALSPEETDWAEITGLYDLLLQIKPSPIVELNRAVALAMRDGPETGLEAIASLMDHKVLQQYHLLHAAKADFCRRLGRTQEAIQSYQNALKWVQQEPERRFLERRLSALLEN